MRKKQKTKRKNSKSESSLKMHGFRGQAPVSAVWKPSHFVIYEFKNRISSTTENLASSTLVFGNRVTIPRYMIFEYAQYSMRDGFFFYTNLQITLRSSCLIIITAVSIAPLVVRFILFFHAQCVLTRKRIVSLWSQHYCRLSVFSKIPARLQNLIYQNNIWSAVVLWCSLKYLLQQVSLFDCLQDVLLGCLLSFSTQKELV